MPPPDPAGDPSMEDILASIRRILNEDEPAGGGGGPAASPPPPAADEPLDLTRDMLVGGPQSAQAKPQPPHTPVAQTGQPAPSEEERPSPGADALLAPAAAAAASASLGQLLRTVAAERGSAVLRSAGPTIEDVVREELRPLLKEWLDQHLPAVVERLVRAEIERVVGRALS
ncbi:MAG: DUF2497 domain-containing protein [Acetobacteraceae bacterium]|nr:DUF2497 domain-containing protein [Acetobacteraceae bacterium]